MTTKPLGKIFGLDVDVFNDKALEQMQQAAQANKTVLFVINAETSTITALYDKHRKYLAAVAEQLEVVVDSLACKGIDILNAILPEIERRARERKAITELFALIGRSATPEQIEATWQNAETIRRRDSMPREVPSRVTLRIEEPLKKPA